MHCYTVACEMSVTISRHGVSAALEMGPPLRHRSTRARSSAEIHHSGRGWVQGVVIMHVAVAKDDGGAM